MMKEELEKSIIVGQSRLDGMWAAMSNDRIRFVNNILRLIRSGTPETREEVLVVKMCISIVGLELDVRDARRELEDK